MLPRLSTCWGKNDKEYSAAALACFLFAFDFMHFTQTRIATIDVYITFFCDCNVLFYVLLLFYEFYDTPLYKTFVPLGLCGICMGLGIASKWTGIYAGCGLALLFLRICCDATGNTSMPKPIPEKHQRHGASADCKEIPRLYGKDDRLLPDLFRAGSGSDLSVVLPAICRQSPSGTFLTVC